MIPSHSITALALTTLPLASPSDPDLHMPVGAAVLTGRVAGGTVTFELASHILTRGARGDSLRDWLDRQLADESATLAMFRPGTVASLLTRLPGSEGSSAVQILSGKRHRKLIDLAPRNDFARLINSRY